MYSSCTTGQHGYTIYECRAEGRWHPTLDCEIAPALDCNAGWDCHRNGQPCLPICGDGLVRGDELCDDKGAKGGCAADCLSILPGWKCNSSSPSTCSSVCGDFVVALDEQGHTVPGNERCDEGYVAKGGSNGAYGGHCSIDCRGTTSWCGDGKLDAEFEVCDLGGLNLKPTGWHSGGETGIQVPIYPWTRERSCTDQCHYNSYCGDGLGDAGEGAAACPQDYVGTPCRTTDPCIIDPRYQADGSCQGVRREACDDGFAWSHSGPIPEWRCMRVTEPRDPDGWDDNFFCVTYSPNRPYLGPYNVFDWLNSPTLTQIVKLRMQGCIAVGDKSEPDNHGWNNSYLCPGEHVSFQWSQAGSIPGMHCVNWNEPRYPHSWNDNYLCWSYK